tara:strand:+ start:418 stop:630 length:213 start_codon:yes stop_codon:yes gene_type:complete
MNSVYILTNKNNTEVINKIEASSLTEAVILLAKIKQLDPDKLLNIYKVTEQKINYGRREIEGGIKKNPQN